MSYWTNRQRQLLQSAEKSEETLKKRLARFYHAEARKMEKEIGSYYAHYGSDNVLTYRTLLQTLSDADVSLLMQRINEFAEKYPQYAHLLPVRESIYKLDRLEGLQTSIRMQQLEIGAYEQAQLRTHLAGLTEKSFDTAYSLGHGTKYSSFNQLAVQTFVNQQWGSASDFSATIWNNREKLAETLSTQLAQGFARGDNYQKLTGMLTERFEKVSRRDAYRLVYTEGTYAMNESTARVFEEDFEFYCIECIHDGKTCDICSAIEDESKAHPFSLKGRNAGVDFPPFHPYCRCAIVPWIGDEQAWIDKYVAKHGGDPEISETQRREAQALLGSFTDDGKDDIISGGISGARNPEGKAAEEHAVKYYGSVRSMRTDVKKVAAASGFTEEEIRRVKNFIFVDEHDLGGGRIARFKPDYMMGESWRRLIAGTPEPHDITMIRHELLEEKLMNEGLSQYEAHKQASAVYNYQRESEEFYGRIKKYRME